MTADGFADASLSVFAGVSVLIATPAEDGTSHPGGIEFIAALGWRGVVYGAADAARHPAASANWQGRGSMLTDDDEEQFVLAWVLEVKQPHGFVAEARLDAQPEERLHVEKLCSAPLTRSRAMTGRPTTSGDPKNMTLKRMDNVLIVVEDLEAAKAFFAALGMQLEGQTLVEGPSVDSTVGLDGVRADIAMMRTPDGHGRVELTRFHTPPAVRTEPQSAPANALGIRRIMFAVDDLDDVIARLRTHGGELVGEIAQYEDSYRLCFVRAPEGFIVGLAEQLS